MKNWLTESEELIRLGLFEDVEKRLLSLKKIARREAADLANIARRINRNDLAIKFLNPIVRSQDKLSPPATPIEKLEYADALRQLGATEESWNLLSDISSEKLPQVLLHQAFCLFTQWRYEEAIPLLQNYVLNPSLDDYPRCLGQINLAAAYIAENQLVLATPLVESLLAETKRLNFMLLYGNSLELRAQIFVSEKKYNQALILLDESRALLESSGKATLYVEKWQSIANSLKKNEITPSLLNVIEKARLMRHWETVRECELYIAFFEKNIDRFQFIYFGTPYKSFRERIVKMATESFKIPTSYLWVSNSKKPAVIFDIQAGQLIGTESEDSQLPVGQVLHRFFILMAQDFFRPRMTLSLFCHLFPDEVVSASTSINRVHQIVKRARAWLKKTNAPLEIEELNGNYRLLIKKDLGVRIVANPPELSDKQIQWKLFVSNLTDTAFTINEMMRILQASASTARRLLKWGQEKKLIERSGQGPKTIYTILKSKANRS